MKKLLFTASTEDHVRRFHAPYLRAFRESGWRVEVACGEGDGTIPEAQRIFRLPLRKKMLASENLVATRMIRRAVAEGDYDLILANTSLAAFFTRLALDPARRPKVVNMVHGYLFDDDTPVLKRNVLLAAERSVASRTDLVLTMNDYDTAVAERYRLGERVARIPGVGAKVSFLDRTSQTAGAELRRALGISPDAFVVLCVAEFSPRKNQKLLLSAAKDLPENAVLVFAGQGQLLERCRRAAADCGRRAIFSGQIEDMGPYYRMADVLVSASRSEGLPHNIMEGMYAGLPVVASAVKGHRDLIAHGETGLLYPFGDATSLAEQVRALAASEMIRTRLGTQARCAVESYRLERVFPLVWRELSALAEVEK